MKKYGLAIVVLIACICASMVSNTTAIYTHSNAFDLAFKFIKHPIIRGDFIKYELNTEKYCDYTLVVDKYPTGGRKCEQGNAQYDNDNNLVKLSQDAGFFSYFKGKEESYLVNGTFDYSTSSPTNFGMLFNGSFYQLGETEMQSIGYILKFDETGNLVIDEQGVVNYSGDVNNHANDRLKVINEKPIRNVQLASSEQVKKMLTNSGTMNPIYLQIRVKKTDEGTIMVYAYINGIRVNQEPITLGYDLRNVNGDTANPDQNKGKYPNVIIGASSFGVNTSVVVSELYKDAWDGVAQ